jgi:hypothetical protein
MTNLSDLLPAGAASKQLSFVATGAISNGQAVGLNSDGTVSVIASAIGSETTFYSGRTSYIATAYDSTNNKIVVFYRDQDDSSKGKAQVGTVSGTSITFGSAVEFEAGQTFYIDAVFDPDSGKVIVSYEDDSNSSYGTVIVGTVSGTSISFGTAVVFESTNTRWTSITYDTNVDRICISYTKYDSWFKGFARAGQVSGTSVAFAGSATRFDTDNTAGYDLENTSIVFDSTNNKVVVIYKGNNTRIQGVVGTISGTSISFGTPADVSAVADYRQPKAVFDSNAGKVFAIFRDNADSYAKGAVGTVSGTSISFGATATLSSITISSFPSAVYDPDNQNIKAIFKQSASPNSVYVFTATISGTSVSASGERVLFSTGSGVDQNSMVYDTTANKVVSAVYLSSNDYGVAFVHTGSAGQPSDNFLGIADAAISNAASGKITMKGGVATNSQLLPLAYSGSIGSKQIFDTDNIDNSFPPSLTFDSSNNKVVIAYHDTTNSVSAAAVGTVSGTSITWGTPVNFVSASAYYISATFDSSNNKVVISYRDSSNSNYGTSIIGTVSGNSISFGTAVVFRSGSVEYLASTFDSSANKVVLGYSNASNADRGEYVVGTVSGTSISFGTVDYFDSSSTKEISITYDSNANKTVFFFRQSNTGKAKVATLSGTAFSFGSQQTFGALTTSKLFSSAFDSSSNKIGVFYSDNDSSSHGTAKMGTVSGTDISFGSAAVFESAEVSGIAATFDSNSNRFVVFYADVGNGNYGTYALGTVSGTDISFDTPAIANAGSTGQTTITFDSSTNRVVLGYRDASDSGKGTAQVIAITGAYPNLVPNTTYYVQDDGSLSTTSSSVTAGKAMSTNSINLDYSS